jgi:hypothetical protein
MSWSAGRRRAEGSYSFECNSNVQVTDVIGWPLTILLSLFPDPNSPCSHLHHPPQKSSD